MEEIKKAIKELSELENIEVIQMTCSSYEKCVEYCGTVYKPIFELNIRFSHTL